MQSSSDLRATQPLNRRRLGIFDITLMALSIAGSVVMTVDASEQEYPDVIDVQVNARGQNIFDFDVTVSSPYDTPDRYADGFHAMSRDGVIYGERKLFHDHASEQPFTRDMYGVFVPASVVVILIQARDKANGNGGKVVEVALPRR